MVVSGGWDRTVQVWDTRQPTPLRHISNVFICGKAHSPPQQQHHQQQQTVFFFFSNWEHGRACSIASRLFSLLLSCIARVFHERMGVKILISF